MTATDSSREAPNQDKNALDGAAGFAGASVTLNTDEGDARVLASMGYKQELRRNFTNVEVFAIAFSIMGVLPSIASTLFFSLPAGPIGLVWGWFLASGFVFIVGLAMAELGSAMPTSGGLYYWTHYYASPSTRNPLSFLVGYSNTLGLIGGLCSLDYGFSLMFLSVIVIARDGEWAPTSGQTIATFICTVLAHGIMASTLSKIMGKLQTISSFMQVSLIIATIIALPIGTASRRNSASFIFTESANLTTWPTGWAFMLAWQSAIWSINGFDSCLHMAEEAANATRAVPLGIISAIGGCWLLGWICCIVIAACINPDVSTVLGSSFGQPMAQIYYDALGKQGALGFMSFMMICQFTMGLSILVAASRQSWAFSRDGALPFSRFFRVISSRFGYIPLRTIWGCVGVAIAIGFLTMIAPAAAGAVFSLGVAGEYLAFQLPIFSRLAWAGARFNPGPFNLGKASKPVAWMACIFLTFGIILAMMPTGGPSPTASSMNYTVVINSAVWGGALLYYFIDARKWFHDPIMTLRDDVLSAEDAAKARREGLNVEVQKAPESGAKELRV